MKKTIVGLLLVLAASVAWGGEYDDEDRDDREQKSWADMDSQERIRQIDRDLEKIEEDRRRDEREYNDRMMRYDLERIRDAVERGYPYYR